MKHDPVIDMVAKKMTIAQISSEIGVSYFKARQIVLNSGANIRKGSPIKIDDEGAARALAMWKAGETYVGLEVEFNASRVTVWKALRRAAGGDIANVKRDVNPTNNHRIDPARAAAMRAEGMRNCDIARRFGVTPAAVCTHFKTRAA